MQYVIVIGRFLSYKFFQKNFIRKYVSNVYRITFFVQSYWKHVHVHVYVCMYVHRIRILEENNKNFFRRRLIGHGYKQAPHFIRSRTRADPVIVTLRVLPPSCLFPWRGIHIYGLTSLSSRFYKYNADIFNLHTSFFSFLLFQITHSFPDFFQIYWKIKAALALYVHI